jgi:CHASE2 domain-containing sensor protein
VVRARAARHPGSTFHLAFAEAVAKAAGVSSWPEARRIPWLREPRGGGDTFLTLDADSVLAADRDPDGALSRAIEAQLHNRVVLIGADVDGRDRHPTPLTRVTGEEMLGVAVHAQVLAGLLDGRALEEIGTVPAAMLAFAATLLGALAGWFAARRRFVLMALLGLGTGLVGAVSAIVLWQSQAIVPLPALVAALIGAAIVARVLRSAIGS